MDDSLLPQVIVWLAMGLGVAFGYCLGVIVTCFQNAIKDLRSRRVRSN